MCFRQKLMHNKDMYPAPLLALKLVFHTLFHLGNNTNQRERKKQKKIKNKKQKLNVHCIMPVKNMCKLCLVVPI